MKNMLRKSIAVLFILSLIMVLGACSGASYTFSGGPKKTTIKVTADDGKYGEGFVNEISKNEVISIDSQLEKGALQIDFMEVINTASADETEDWSQISTIKSVTVNPGDQLEFALDYSGNYMPVVTSIGQSSGTVIISIVKKQ